MDSPPVPFYTNQKNSPIVIQSWWNRHPGSWRTWWRGGRWNPCRRASCRCCPCPFRQYKEHGSSPPSWESKKWNSAKRQYHIRIKLHHNTAQLAVALLDIHKHNGIRGALTRNDQIFLVPVEAHLQMSLRQSPIPWRTCSCRLCSSSPAPSSCTDSLSSTPSPPHDSSGPTRARASSPTTNHFPPFARKNTLAFSNS